MEKSQNREEDQHYSLNPNDGYRITSSARSYCDYGYEADGETEDALRASMVNMQGNSSFCNNILSNQEDNTALQSYHAQTSNKCYFNEKDQFHAIDKYWEPEEQIEASHKESTTMNAVVAPQSDNFQRLPSSLSATKQEEARDADLGASYCMYQDNRHTSTEDIQEADPWEEIEGGTQSNTYDGRRNKDDVVLSSYSDDMKTADENSGHISSWNEWNEYESEKYATLVDSSATVSEDASCLDDCFNSFDYSKDSTCSPSSTSQSTECLPPMELNGDGDNSYYSAYNNPQDMNFNAGHQGFAWNYYYDHSDFGNIQPYSDNFAANNWDGEQWNQGAYFTANNWDGQPAVGEGQVENQYWTTQEGKTFRATYRLYKKLKLLSV